MTNVIACSIERSVTLLGRCQGMKMTAQPVAEESALLVSVPFAEGAANRTISLALCFGKLWARLNLYPSGQSDIIRFLPPCVGLAELESRIAIGPDAK